jgi:hypothetical protein
VVSHGGATSAQSAERLVTLLSTPT